MNSFTAYLIAGLVVSWFIPLIVVLVLPRRNKNGPATTE